MNNKIKLTMSLKDEYGRKYKLKRKYDSEQEEDYGTIYWHLEQFKDFLHSIGFDDAITDYLIYLEHGESVEYEGQTVLHRAKM